jgi:uncharacterized membrane protein
MIKCSIVVFIIFVISSLIAPLSFAAGTTPTPANTPTPVPTAIPKAPPAPIETYETAKVLSVLAQGIKTVQGQKSPYQKLQLQVLNGSDKGKTMTLTYGDLVELRPEQEVSQGATVVLMKSVTGQKTSYEIVDTYRLNNLYPIAILFLVVVLLVTRLKGLGAVIGLGISLSIIVFFIVPQILAGRDPLLASIVGGMFIMIATMYLAHGFSQKTNIALISTSISLVLTGVLSYAAVHLTFLTGLGSEDAASLQFGQTGNINFQGLLLGGIIIGSLGVLEDITTGLAASIQELTRANSRLKFRELISAGLRIGSEHIAALVNTLVLAYAGVALPIFLFVVIDPGNQPLWYIINSDYIMEEIVRTLAGSIGLILSVPLTAIFAAWAFHQKTR